MSLPWFRLYTEFLTDPVIRMLAPSDRAVFIDVLCMKAMGVLDKEYVTKALRNAVIERYVGLSNYADEKAGSALELTRSRLMAQGLIDENWQPTNWEKRQFQKDTKDPTGAERQRRFRERQAEKRSETLRNGDVTSIEQIQNRTDTEQKKDKRGRLRASRVPEGFSPDLEFAKAQLPDMAVEQEAQKFRDWEFRTPRSDWSAAWRQWVQRCRETGRYAKIEVTKWE